MQVPLLHAWLRRVYLLLNSFLHCALAMTMSEAAWPSAGEDVGVWSLSPHEGCRSDINGTMFQHAALLTEVPPHATCVLQGSEVLNKVHGITGLSSDVNSDKAKAQWVNAGTVHCPPPSHRLPITAHDEQRP